jgi:hypothetical protein
VVPTYLHSVIFHGSEGVVIFNFLLCFSSCLHVRCGLGVGYCSGCGHWISHVLCNVSNVSTMFFFFFLRLEHVEPCVYDITKRFIALRIHRYIAIAVNLPTPWFLEPPVARKNLPRSRSPAKRRNLTPCHRPGLPSCNKMKILIRKSMYVEVALEVQCRTI